MERFDSLEEVYIKYSNDLSEALSCAPRGMEVKELTGVGFELTNARNRLINISGRNPSMYFHIGEFLWYLRGSDKLEIIKYYSKMYPRFSDDQQVLYGAYGKRIFASDESGKSAWEHIIKLLKKDLDTRQAVLSIHEQHDLYSGSKDIPCTCTIQYLLRQERLYCITYMRSNDLYLGLPYDVFSFTMLQEMLANELGVELGTYKHFVGSLHVYEKNYKNIEQSRKTEISSSKPMDKMPPLKGEQKVKLLALEEKLRLGKMISGEEINDLEPYWRQFIIVLMHKSAEVWGMQKPEYSLDERYARKLFL